MANYYMLEKDLMVNDAEGKKTKFEAGRYVLTEADGTLSSCTEEELQSNIDRIDADIIARNAKIEVDRLAEEEAQQEQSPEEPQS